MYCKATQNSLAVLSVLCTRLTHCWLPLLTLEAAALLTLCIVLLLLECCGIGISQSVAFGHWLPSSGSMHLHSLQVFP